MLILDSHELKVSERPLLHIYEEEVGKLGEAWGVVLEDGQRGLSCSATNSTANGTGAKSFRELTAWGGVLPRGRRPWRPPL